MENEISIPASLIDRYEILTPFDEEASVFLVRDRLTKELAVEKMNYDSCRLVLLIKLRKCLNGYTALIFHVNHYGVGGR